MNQTERKAIEVIRATQFKRDYKREKKTDGRLDETLAPVIELLLRDDPLPQRLQDHALGGIWKGYRDCHIKLDLVLIYEKSSDVLKLMRIGSHSEVFE